MATLTVHKTHACDPRWQWMGNGWLTINPALVAEALERLAASKKART